MSSSSDPQKGDYVLATKFEDGDPCDPWCIGFYDGLNEKGRYMVIDKHGNNFRLAGYGAVYKISQRRGQWILDNKDFIERSNVMFIDWLKTPYSVLQLIKT